MVRTGTSPTARAQGSPQVDRGQAWLPTSSATDPEMDVLTMVC
jgi:hypothetical protein